MARASNNPEISFGGLTKPSHWESMTALYIVIIGMTTNHCISTTVRMSGNLGYDTYLISDSTACYNTIGNDGEEIDCEIIYNVSIANLKDEFARIINSKKLFELLN